MKGVSLYGGLDAGALGRFAYNAQAGTVKFSRDTGFNSVLTLTLTTLLHLQHIETIQSDVGKAYITGLKICSGKLDICC